MGAVLAGVSALCCCCTSCACCACSSVASCCCGSKGLPSGKCAKVAHCILFGLASVVALVLRYRGDSLNIDIDAWNVNCVNEYNVRYSFCHGDAAVYRISFACTFFFFFVMLAAMCSPSFHRGYWFPKLFFFLGLLLASIWIPNNVFDNSGFALVARVVSSLFLALQAVILIEFSAQWNERWVDRAYGGDGGTAEPTDPKWLYTVLVSAAAFYAAAIAGIACLYVYYADCTTGRGFTTVALVCSCALTLISLFRRQLVGEEGAILPAGVMCFYVVYLTWSALDSNPDEGCKPSTKRDTATICVGVTIAAFSLTCVAHSASPSDHSAENDAVHSEDDDELAKPFYRVDDADTEGNDTEAALPLSTKADEPSVQGIDHTDTAESAEADSDKGRYWTFHLVMMAASLYMAMLFTNWGAQGTSNNAKVSMWVKIASSWLAAALYAWTVVAPRMLREREF